MRKILIVGAGQAGLQLALSLQSEGYDVTVMSARTPDEIRNGWPTSTQVMMYRALDRERDVKLNLWDGTAQEITGIGFNLSPAPGVSAFSFSGAWARPGNSVDQRLKMSTWIELFEQRGGRVIYHSVMTSDLAGLAPIYDLTVIAAGKGEIVEMFDTDRQKTPYTRPMRHTPLRRAGLSRQCGRIASVQSRLPFPDLPVRSRGNARSNKEQGGSRWPRSCCSTMCKG